MSEAEQDPVGVEEFMRLRPQSLFPREIVKRVLTEIDSDELDLSPVNLTDQEEPVVVEETLRQTDQSQSS